MELSLKTVEAIVAIHVAKQENFTLSEQIGKK